MNPCLKAPPVRQAGFYSVAEWFTVTSSCKPKSTNVLKNAP